MPDDVDKSARDEVARRALSIALALAVSDPGEKAAARRMDKRGAPVFWRQVARLGISSDHEAGWLRFTRMVALLTPASATASVHDKDRPLGAVLADAGFSEQRLARLLASQGDTRLEALERAIRMLARSRPKIDVVSLARTVMGWDHNRLARDYYTRLDRTTTIPTGEVEHA
ncbi:type I-E CRISPR-associated protein Cse2/CasB [Methylobrevis pamukkalensis]|uniref:CRISPR-associated protein Cse2 n=1 Tax=Methylobrevis pamukkalensis TaxID=1439726 RepID=A0A1E3GQJ5_9HYPH|nr:type I-E CRISPR-associated protein Cse2/CasB [Methylobrevis pamukkalensis]ODN66294.1 CRISPR-associated protein Cse2 [Methylobrevis pamukkalensis]